MLSMTFFAFFFLSLVFFSLPIHSSPASLGGSVLFVVVLLLMFFISLNSTLVAIFITLVYVSGILILFSYFFSLIQNAKIFFVPLLIALGSMSLATFLFFFYNFHSVYSQLLLAKTTFGQMGFIWVLLDSKLIFFFILILLISMLFIEKTIGLKQKPLRVS